MTMVDYINPVSGVICLDEYLPIYSPNHDISGKANVYSPNPISPDKIYILYSVDLLLHRPLAFDKDFKKVRLFSTKVVQLYDKSKSRCASGVRPSEWPFSFKLPNTQKVPPPFFYNAHRHTTEIVHTLSLLILGLSHPHQTYESPGLGIYIMPECPSGILTHVPVTVHNRQIEVMNAKFVHGEMRSVSLAERARRLWRTSNADNPTLNVKVNIPQMVCLDEHIDVQLLVENAQSMPHSIMCEPKLKKVRYTLWAYTRIATNNSSEATVLAVQHEEQNLNDHVADIWTYLRRRAPFRVKPKGAIVSERRSATTSVGPTFSIVNIQREYKLDVVFDLELARRIYEVRFDGNELIVLPPI